MSNKPIDNTGKIEAIVEELSKGERARLAELLENGQKARLEPAPASVQDRSPRIIIDKALVEELEVDTLIAMQEGDMKVIKAVLGQFVLVGEEYLPAEEGREYIGRLKLKELGRVIQGIARRVTDIVPEG